MIRHSDPEFFLYSPFHSPYFVGTTVMVILVVVIAGVLTLRFRSQLPFEAMAWIALAVAATLVVWIVAINVHRAVNARYRNGTGLEFSTGSHLHYALSTAAKMTHLGVMYTALAAGAALLALGWAIGRR